MSITRLVSQLVPKQPPPAAKDPDEPLHPSLAVVVESLSDATSPGDRSFALGVLFVHGVGEQGQGDTLTEMGDPLIQWLKRWVERPPLGQLGGPKGHVRILSASLRQPVNDLVSFSNLALEVAVPEGKECRTSTWLMGESWWADVFRPPSFGEFAAWGIGVSQWEAVTQILDISERLQVPAHAPPWLRASIWPLAVFLMAILVMASILASTFLLLFALALTTLRLIPIGPVQQAAVAGQRVMAMGAGDAFILVRSPARFAAMVSRVRDDLAQMRKHCREVIVIAHSQGAQVAWEAIRRSEPGSEAIPKAVSRFVTFGQALRRLKLLYRLTHPKFDRADLPPIIGGVAAQLGLLVLLAAVADVLLNSGDLLHLVLSWLPGPPSAAVIPFFTALLAVLVGGEAVVLNAGNAQNRASGTLLWREIRNASKGKGEEEFEWTDMWASADPISNGSLLSSPPPRVTSWRIHNLGSPILDHVVYWQNLTEFVAAIATDLGSRAFPGSPYFPAEYPHGRLIAASQQRGARVTTLTLLRVGWVVTVVAWTPAILTWLHEPLVAVSNAVQTWPIVGGPAKLLDPILPVTLGLLVAGTSGLSLWRLLSRVWRGGVAADERAFFWPRVQGGMATVQSLFPPSSWFALAFFAAPLSTPLLLYVAGWPVLAKLHFAVVIVAMLAVPTIVSGGRRMGDEFEPQDTLIRRSSRRRLIWMCFVGVALIVAASTAAEHHALTREIVEPAAWAVLGLVAVLLAVAAANEFRHFWNRYESYRAQILFEQENLRQPGGQ